MSLNLEKQLLFVCLPLVLFTCRTTANIRSMELTTITR